MLNIERLIDWIKNHKARTFFIVGGLFIIPLILVHLLFKLKTDFYLIYAEWSAGDVIQYIAGFEAFIGTVALGVIAVFQTDKANKINNNILEITNDNERKSVLPFLSFNAYVTNYEKQDLIGILTQTIRSNAKEEYASTQTEGTAQRTDYLLNELIFTIAHNSIQLNTALSPEQQEKIRTPFGIKKSEKITTITTPDYCYKKIYIENCGKGSAINLKCRVYKIGEEESKEFDVWTIPFTVPVDKHFDLGLYFDLSEPITGNYKLSFTYQDIYSNKYIQIIPISLEAKTYSLDFYQTQERL